MQQQGGGTHIYSYMCSPIWALLELEELEAQALVESQSDGLNRYAGYIYICISDL